MFSNSNQISKSFFVYEYYSIMKYIVNSLSHNELQIAAVREQKEQLLERRKQCIEKRQQAAEAKRAAHLSEVRRRAHDETEKVEEIAFINELGVESRKHDLLVKDAELRHRLQGIQVYEYEFEFEYARG